MKPHPRNKIIEADLEYLRSRPIEWGRFQNKTVLVTGASGFLPAYMVELLHSLGEHGDIQCKIMALVRNEARARSRFAHLLDSPRFELLVQDVCEPIETVQMIDFIVHAASQASPKYYAKDPLGTFDANVRGTWNLLKLGQSKGIESFLFFSSGEVYGQVDASCIPITENDYGRLDPSSLRSCYAEGKRAGKPSRFAGITSTAFRHALRGHFTPTVRACCWMTAEYSPILSPMLWKAGISR